MSKKVRWMPMLLSALVFVCTHETWAGSYQSPLDYASSAVFTITNYTKATAQAYFPLYLKIASDNPKGFRYEDLKNGKDELRFLDTTGQSLPYEVETWNENGESAFWIRVPSLRSGETITMCWNLRDGCNLPPRDPIAERESLWSDYVGVWHMGETITAAEAFVTPSYDATGHGYDIVPKAGTAGDLSRTISVPGVFGNARVNDTTKAGGKNGNGLFISGSEAFQFNGVFTLSFWIKFDDYQNWPQIVSGRWNANSTVGVQVDLNSSDRKKIIARGNGNSKSGEYRQVVDKPFKEMGFVHLAFVYNGDNVRVYSDGVLKMDEGITAATTNILMLGNNHSLTEQSVYGKYDEVRLYKGVRSIDSIVLEHAQATNALYTAGIVTNDWTAVLKNEWLERPSVTRTTWPKESHPSLADFSATPKHNADKMYIEFYNRGTGANIGRNPPTKPGEYRAVFIVPQADGWGALQDEVGFRIVKDEGTHELVGVSSRILLAQDDDTVEGGKVSFQAYNDEWSDLFWTHLADDHVTDESTSPYSKEYEYLWTVSPDFNFGGGTYHQYCYETNGVTNVLWTLDGVRVGNTFDRMCGEPVLHDGQNYLPWNEDSCRVLNFYGETIGDYARYAGQMLLQNKVGAQIVSSCYTNGIGTIYFDAVNGWTGNIFNDEGGNNYELVVEVSTNAIGSTRPPTDANISSNPEKGSAAYDPFLYADWKRVDVRVLRFDDGACFDLGMQDRLRPEIATGASLSRFYRIIVPVNVSGYARFRIRRTAIDPKWSWNPDGDAYILVDNVICSDPAACVNLSPYGLYDATLTGKSVQGWGGALVPAFPAADDTIYPRMKATMADGSAVPKDLISAATMHYRWHYIDQRTTDWLAADLDPATLGAKRPLDVPAQPGDIEFWFEANPHGTYYEYGDYSGQDLGLGKCGYSEAVLAVTNRLSATRNWFVRMREGKSAYSSMKLLVKKGVAESAYEEVEMYVTDNHMWRGYYRMTEALEQGIWWRIEPRDEQTDGATTWNYSTNRWYVADWTAKPPTFPASGRMSEGTTASWSRMTCDKQTGYLMFQVDESTLGITVIHADYQNFNDWNQPNDFFSGSTSDTNGMQGVSADIKTYAENYAGWTDESPSDDLWQLVFKAQIGDPGYEGYKQFASIEDYFRAWNLGKGMWVYGKYREPNSKVAYQAAGCGEGYAEFTKTGGVGGNWPRGIGSVSFNARLAQAITPDKMSYNYVGRMTTAAPGFIPSAMMTNYTLMVRGCFDRKQNEGFAGNAALSLFAYYQPRVGAYEARWEQIQGQETTNPQYPTKYLGPKKNGQRLVISRWDAVGETYQETVLYAVTNAGSWNLNMPLTPYESTTATNNLLPFCIAVTKRANDTVVAAAIRVSASAPTGVNWDRALTDMKDRWYFAVAIDNSAKQLKSGSYGVLTSNSEGLMLTPQFREAFTRPEGVAIADLRRGFYTNKTLDGTDFDSCYSELANTWWSINKGRQASFYGTADTQPYGFTYVADPQTVDIYTSPVDRDTWTKLGAVPITDFGTPYNQPDVQTNLYFTQNCKVRLRTGGTLDDYRKDVVMSDIVLTQWRGRDNWSTSGSDWDFVNDRAVTANSFGYTNVVFTTGWVTNGAVRLSAKRTSVGLASSVRSPLFDGNHQEGYGYRGVGLGQIGIRYREPTRNIRLKVQVATNYTESVVNLSRSVVEDSTHWITVTNLNYTMLMDTAHWDPVKGEGVWTTRLGWHGVKGLMRIVIDDTLTQEVATETDPTKFGEIDVLEAVCKDEPALDKSCWWGWNLKAVGDVHDTAQRMYLADYSPLSLLADSGQSMALNNSTVDGTNPAEDPADFKKHLPFVQSPVSSGAFLGQISFKARKYELSDRAADAKVAVYGAPKNPDLLAYDDDWVKLGEFDVTNTLYETYTCKTLSEKYYALRLVVLIDGTIKPPEEAKGVKNPQRVIFDEVVVSESVAAKMSFRNVGAFRDGLETTGYVPGVTTAAQQPLCDESWGIQAEIFATMLEDEIYREKTPNVTLHWFVGEEPWGYENWKNSSSAGHAPLAPADGTNYVYRSSYEKAREAVMPAQQNANTVVQYMLEVEYWTIHSDKGWVTIQPATNWLDAVAWQTPSWYAPLDYNADAWHGAGKTFAGYTILDTVAPGWAWINEMNIFGTYKNSTYRNGWDNTDEDFQYVEVCAPIEADLSGWQVRFLDSSSQSGNVVVTNYVARFGAGALSGTKTLNMASNMVFHCIGNKETRRMKKGDGSLDGLWRFSESRPTETSIFCQREDGMFYTKEDRAFGAQLLRPSGIIESSVVVIGTNYWAGGYFPEYEPANVVEKLNRLVPGSKFFFPCADEKGEGKSESVIDSRGESAIHWSNDWLNSPGYLNTNGTGRVQQIDPNHPTPKGDKIIVYATIDKASGPIRQYVGGKGSTATNTTEVIILKKGGSGTNIVYVVDPWYELASVKTNGLSAWLPGPTARRELEFMVGVGASNTINVLAAAKVDRELVEKYGLDEKNRYTPAVMKWLVGGKTLKRDFQHNGTIAEPLAGLYDYGDNFVTNLTLTSMYWLDMDPTVSNQIMKAALIKVDPYVPPPEANEPYTGNTNVKMTVFMMISNEVDQVYSPYVLRGLEPGSTSWDYKPDTSPAWTSETFKVTGILCNGQTSIKNPNHLIPLRWFVFDRDSFYQPLNPEGEEPFTAKIEIVDPLSISSPGADAGWYKWGQEHGYTPVFHAWAIDERLKPITPEMLKPDSYYNK